jgi:DNA-binding transcriptional regulator YbjK
VTRRPRGARPGRAPGRKEHVLEAAVGVLAEHGAAGTTHTVLAHEPSSPRCATRPLRAATDDGTRAGRAVLGRFVDPVTARGVDALIEVLIMHNAPSEAPLRRAAVRRIVARMV